MSRVLNRHRQLLRPLAWCLLLLAASPCTAPFLTLDLAPPATATLLDSSKPKGSTEDILAAPAVWFTPQAIASGVASITRAARRDSALDARHFVLRL